MRKLLLMLLPFAAACVGESQAKKPAPSKASKTVETGLDLTAIDHTVKPCDDFYQFACGNWLKRTKIPEDRSQWYRSFSEIDERNETTLHQILEDLAAGKNKADPFAEKVGAFYGSCMDEKKIEASGEGELQDLLKRVDAIKDLDGLAREVAQLHLSSADSTLFDFGQQQDFKDASLVVASADQGGLGLPDRDYYLKDDAKSKELRQKYEEHVRTMLGFAGAAPSDAAKQAQTVLRIEKLLAEPALSKTDRRDPKKLDHRLELDGLVKTAPKFPWKLYLAEIGIPQVTQINVLVPPFFGKLNELLTTVPLADWKTYLRWHVIHAAAPTLPKRYDDENFNFYAKTLQGQDKQLPRWKRCVKATDQALGEALARPYVRLTFGAEGKAETQAMVKGIETAMEQNLSTLSWMDEATRKAALEKLHAINNKIGYPDKWRDYESLAVTRDSFLANAQRAKAFESKRQLAKIGKPVDKNEWLMTPPTVNAYYEPALNEMVFPAGILQPPFFGKSAHPAVNYGAIGMVMGHELTHGFDDEGRQFDAKGNLHNWWSKSVNEDFEKRAACVATQYDGYTVLDGLHLNGKLTLGENIADLGGIKLAHAAYVAQRKAPSKIGEFSDDQLFFLGVAQAWCGLRREAVQRMRVTVDPHSPAEYRVNGPLSNLKEFSDAFQCAPGSKMVRAGQNQCIVW